MNDNSAQALIVAAVCVMLGMACLATHSADPLWILILVWFFIL